MTRAGRLANTLPIFRRPEPPQHDARSIVEPTEGLGGGWGAPLVRRELKLSTVIPAIQQRPQRFPGKSYASKFLYSLPGDGPVLTMEALHPNKLLGVGGHQDQTPR